MAGNQYKADPRQSLFLSYYIDTKSKTFSNALQSALKAGYSRETSESITSSMPNWLSESLGKNNRLVKAEKVLDKTLEYSTETDKGVDTNLLRVQTDVAKFIASTLGKDRGYSSRSEVTGKDGKDLPTPILQGVIDVHTDNSSKETK